MNSRMIKRISIAGFILVVLGLLIIPRYCSKREIQTGEGVRGAIIPVTVEIVKRTTMENNLQVAGSVIGNEEIDLRTEISGKVILIGFKEDYSFLPDDPRSSFKSKRCRSSSAIAKSRTTKKTCRG